MMMWRVFGALVALFYGSLSIAQEQAYCSRPQLPAIQALEDASGRLTAEEVQSLPDERFGSLYSPPFPLEFSYSSIWLRFTVSNDHPVPCLFWLTVGEPRLGNVQVYLLRGNDWSTMVAGSEHPFEQWAAQTRQPLFALPLAEDEQVQVLVRVTSKSVMMIHPRLWDELTLLKATQRLYLADGLALGIVLLIVPFSLIMSLLMSSRLLLVNALAILVYILLCCVVNGYLYYWPSLLPWSRQLVAILGGGSFVLFTAYLWVLFGVRLMPAWWRYLLMFYAVLMSGLLFWGAVDHFIATRILFSEWRWLNYILVPLLCIGAWYRGLKPNWLAWLLTILFVIQGVSRHWLGVKDVSWQYGEDQLSLTSSLPGVLLLVCTLMIEYSRSRRSEQRAMADLDEQQKAAQERLESTVARRTEQLSESLRARSSLLARISHDLRSPLASIIDYARLLQGESAHPYPPRIERNARQQLEMIDELLEFSRSELQQLELVLAPGYLYGFVHEIEDEGRFLTLRQHNRFVCHVAEDLPLLVRADFRRLRQILINLLANAAKFTRDGLIEFSVACVGADGPSVRLRFTVSDTGIGMHPDEREQLLQPFRRGRNAARYEGAGLGLSIVSQLLQQMGSVLRVEPGTVRGSRFSFELELPRATEDELDMVMGDKPGMQIRGEGRRVLLVDDIEQNLEALSDLLGGLGFEVLLAREGREALDLLDEHAFDLVITDQMMPGLDGWDLLRAVRAQWPLLPVLLYSAAPPLRPTRVEAALVFDAALLKPATSHELLARMTLLLELR